jgi:hypothetical protein
MTTTTSRLLGIARYEAYISKSNAIACRKHLRDLVKHHGEKTSMTTKPLWRPTVSARRGAREKFLPPLKEVGLGDNQSALLAAKSKLEPYRITCVHGG